MGMGTSCHIYFLPCQHYIKFQRHDWWSRLEMNTKIENPILRIMPSSPYGVWFIQAQAQAHLDIFKHTHTFDGFCWSTFCKNIYPKYEILMWIIHCFLLKLMAIKFMTTIIRSRCDSWQTLKGLRTLAPFRAKNCLIVYATGNLVGLVAQMFVINCINPWTSKEHHLTLLALISKWLAFIATKTSPPLHSSPQMPELEFTESELEAVTMVFKQYETGLREACIDVKAGPDIHILGINRQNNNKIKIKPILL